MMNEKQIKERIYELEKEIRTLEYVLSKKSEGIGRPKGSHHFTEEQVKFLMECEEKKLTDKEITKQFNNKFGTSYPAETRAFYNFMNRQGIKTTFNTHIKFDEEEDKFIKENADKLTQLEIAEKLGRTRDSIKTRMKLLGSYKHEVEYELR